jgi:putative transposase
MKRITKNGKETKQVFESIHGVDWMHEEFCEVMMTGKKALDCLMMDLGRNLAEAVMHWNREQIAGKDYNPLEGYQKWGTQVGSVYLGDQKIKVSHPRLRKGGAEVLLESYEKLKHPGTFSEELLTEAMRGMSGRKY